MFQLSSILSSAIHRNSFAAAFFRFRETLFLLNRMNVYCSLQFVECIHDLKALCQLRFGMEFFSYIFEIASANVMLCILN